MDFKEAIAKKYICDYNIYLPILEDESATNLNNEIQNIKTELNDNLENIVLCKKCCYLFECMKRFGTLKCIVYFQSHEEIENFIKYFNKINEYYYYDYEIDSIICNNTKKQRNAKLDKFKNSEQSYFLCAVNILDECIDIPQCNSIFMTYNSTSKIKNIQRMSRSMRLDQDNPNKRAIIMLWCNEISDTLTFMSSIKEIDLNFNEKVKFIGFNKHMVKISELIGISKKYEEKYMKYIVGIKEYRGFNWHNMLDKVDKFIIANNKRPSSTSKNKEEKIMHTWVGTQVQNFKNKSQIMKNNEVYNKWLAFTQKHKQHFINNEEAWFDMLNKVENFLNENNRRPTRGKSENESILCYWVELQTSTSKSKINIMRIDDIRDEWFKFTTKHKEHFTTDEEKWYIMFDKVEKFIIENNRRPLASKDNNDEDSMNSWINRQQLFFINKKGFMKTNQIMHDKWKSFIEKNDKYIFIKTSWDDMLEKLNKFITDNNKRPSSHAKIKEEKQLSNWIFHQQNNYKNKTQCMGEQDKYDKWTNFKKIHEKYLLTDEEFWFNTFDKLNDFIKENNRKPTPKNDEKILNNWMHNQTTQYNNKKGIMKQEIYYNKWSSYIENCNKYILSDEEEWSNTFNNLNDFITKNNRKPSCNSNNDSEKYLNNWMRNQNTNYKNQTKIMKIINIYNKWTTFIENK